VASTEDPETAFNRARQGASWSLQVRDDHDDSDDNDDWLMRMMMMMMMTMIIMIG
jgi:hypothetical protein